MVLIWSYQHQNFPPTELTSPCKVIMREVKTMRPQLLAILVAVTVTPGMAQAPNAFVTAPDAILCVGPSNLNIAHRATVRNNQVALKTMGCFRTEGGVQARLLERSDPGNIWRVRFYPIGISGGVDLWGLPSSFTKPDGGEDVAAKRAGF